MKQCFHIIYIKILLLKHFVVKFDIQLLFSKNSEQGHFSRSALDIQWKE